MRRVAMVAVILSVATCLQTVSVASNDYTPILATSAVLIGIACVLIVQLWIPGSRWRRLAAIIAGLIVAGLGLDLARRIPCIPSLYSERRNRSRG